MTEMPRPAISSQPVGITQRYDFFDAVLPECRRFIHNGAQQPQIDRSLPWVTAGTANVWDTFEGRMIGRRIGSWTLEREVVRGRMGAVYEASHVKLRTRAAMKVLSLELQSEADRQRFHREADLQSEHTQR